MTATLTATNADDDNVRQPVTEGLRTRWPSLLGHARIF